MFVIAGKKTYKLFFLIYDYYSFYSFAPLPVDVNVVWGPGVYPPEAAADGDDDEGHQGDDERPEVIVGFGERRLLRRRFRL